MASLLDRLLPSHPVWALLVISILTTILFLLAFRYTTQPWQIKTAKNGMQACLLEVRLFKDSPSLVMAALWGMIIHNGRYLRHSLKPVALTLPLLVPLLSYLDTWFGHVPLRPGQSGIITVKLRESAGHDLDRISLKVPIDVCIETAPLRLSDESQISWAIRVNKSGKYQLCVKSLGGDVFKTLVVSDGGSIERAVPRLGREGFWNRWLHPGEALLPQRAEIDWIEVNYPPRAFRLMGWQAHWLVLFFLFSCGFGFIASPVLRVTV
jgi:uncharacterized membrane protein (DUF106 family)